MELLDRMQNKIGPLPTWAWVAIPAGGYVVLSYMRSRNATPMPVDEAVSDSSAVDDYGINTGSSFLPSYGAAPSGSSNLPGFQVPDFDNLAWSKQGINFLISEGVTPTDAATAIGAYINGFPTTLNSSQMAALQKVLQRFGAAPDGSTYLPTQADNANPTPTAVPEMPTTVNAVLLGNNGVRVTWGVPQQANGTILGYRVSWQSGKNNVWTNAGSSLVLPTARSYDQSGLARKTWYRFYVEARNAKGWSQKAGKSILTT